MTATKTKTTSLDKVREACALHGWTVTEMPCDVKIPDPDPSKGYIGRYSSRRSWVPKISVPGINLYINNQADGSRKSANLYFTEGGSYRADDTTGDYPFRMGQTLRDVLEQIENKSAANLATIQAERDRMNVEHKQRQIDRAVELQAEAQTVYFGARADAAHRLVEMGLNSEQVVAVLDAIDEPVSVLSHFAAQATNMVHHARLVENAKNY